VQRLFSTFADGWPGAGLLLLRLLTGAALINLGIGSIREGPPSLTIVLQTVGIAAGIVLLVACSRRWRERWPLSQKCGSHACDSLRIPTIPGSSSSR